MATAWRTENWGSTVRILPFSRTVSADCDRSKALEASTSERSRTSRNAPVEGLFMTLLIERNISNLTDGSLIDRALRQVNRFIRRPEASKNRHGLRSSPLRGSPPTNVYAGDFQLLAASL